MIQSVSIAEERSGTGEILISLALFVCESGRAEAAARATEAMRKIGGTKKKENRPISRRLDKMTLQPNRHKKKGRKRRA